jgi:hypothetical protein
MTILVLNAHLIIIIIIMLGLSFVRPVVLVDDELTFYFSILSSTGCSITFGLS